MCFEISDQGVFREIQLFPQLSVGLWH